MDTRSGLLDRYLPSVLMAIAVMLLGWVGVTVNNLQTAQADLTARFDERVGFLSEQVTKLEKKLDALTAERNTASETQLAERNRRLDSLLDALEQRLNSLEAK